jgi:hypothetical protein
MGFSQSLLGASIGADTIPKTKYQPIADMPKTTNIFRP